MTKSGSFSKKIDRKQIFQSNRSCCKPAKMLFVKGVSGQTHEIFLTKLGTI